MNSAWIIQGPFKLYTYILYSLNQNTGSTNTKKKRSQIKTSEWFYLLFYSSQVVGKCNNQSNHLNGRNLIYGILEKKTIEISKIKLNQLKKCLRNHHMSSTIVLGLSFFLHILTKWCKERTDKLHSQTNWLKKW